MSEVKFGDRTELVASPGNVLKIAQILEMWLREIAASNQEIDVERECIRLAEEILAGLFTTDEGDTCFAQASQRHDH